MFIFSIFRANVVLAGVHNLLIDTAVFGLVFTEFIANRADNNTTHFLPMLPYSSPFAAPKHVDVRLLRRLIAFDCSLCVKT